MAQSLKTDAEIAVIGGGPSGMIAAALLARQGFDVVLVGPQARDDPRTTALLAASVRILDEIGAWPELEKKAAPLARMRIVDDTGRLVRAPEVVFDSAEIKLTAFGYNVPNDDLNAALGQAIDSAGVRRITTFVSKIMPLADSVEMTLAGGERLSVRLVVAADGRESAARTAADISVRRWSYPQSALVTNLTHAFAHDETSSEFHTPHGPFTLVPLPGNRSSLVWVGAPDAIARIAALDDDAFALAAERQAESFLGAMQVDGPRGVFPLSGLQATTLAARRIALVGEAAHVFPPIGAQGLNLSLRDVAALAGTCKAARNAHQDIGGEAALARYRSTRSADITTRLYGVDALNRTLLADFLPVQLARSLGLYAVGRLGPLRRMLMREGVAPRFGVTARM